MAELGTLNPPFAIVESDDVGPGTIRPFGFPLAEVLQLRALKRCKVTLSGTIAAFDGSTAKIELDGSTAEMLSSVESEAEMVCPWVSEWTASKTDEDDQAGERHCITPNHSPQSSFDNNPQVTLPPPSTETDVRESYAWCTIGFRLRFEWGFTAAQAVYLSGGFYWPIGSMALDVEMRQIEFDAVPEEMGIACYEVTNVTAIESHFANNPGSGFKVTILGREFEFEQPSALGFGELGDVTIEPASAPDAFWPFT